MNADVTQMMIFVLHHVFVHDERCTKSLCMMQEVSGIGTHSQDVRKRWLCGESWLVEIIRMMMLDQHVCVQQERRELQVCVWIYKFLLLVVSSVDIPWILFVC